MGISPKLPAFRYRPRSCLIGLVVLGWLAGCGGQANQAVVVSPTRTAEEPPARAPEPAAERFFEEPPPDDPSGKLVEETWDSHRIQGKRVGYARTRIAEVEEQGQKLIRTSTFLRTQMQRGGQETRQDLAITNWDTPDGKLVRFESRASQGGAELVSVGAVKDGQLGIDTTTLGRTQSQKIPWKDEWGGIFAPDQSLRARPLVPGESRHVRSLLPMFNTLGETQFKALDHETVTLPVGPVKLLKVACAMVIGTQKIETEQWMDEQGRALRLLVPGIAQESVRTTKADALRAETGEQYDLLLASLVPTKGELANPQATREVRYRARMKSGTVKGLFAEGASQSVTLNDDTSAEITVRALRPADPLPAMKQQPPSTADLEANSFIQVDDAEVAALARAAAPPSASGWQLACELEKFVAGAVATKSYSQAFATAAEVARSREGDCTEHSLLYAALCRQRKLPCRVAFGFVYYPPARALAGHMWNEVWVEDRWIPMDSTLGRGGIGADRLKLGDSNLSGGSPLVDMLAVIQAIGRLEITIAAVQ